MQRDAYFPDRPGYLQAAQDRDVQVPAMNAWASQQCLFVLPSGESGGRGGHIAPAKYAPDAVEHPLTESSVAHRL